MLVELKRIEKFEVRKGSKVYTYTGVLTDLKDSWVEIKTTRGEVLRYRKEQIEGRQLIELKGNENGKEK